MPLEVVCIRKQFFGGTFAVSKPDSPLLVIDGDQVDFRIRAIPVSLDGMSEGKISKAIPAPLFVELPHHDFEAVPFNDFQMRARLLNKCVQRAKIDGCCWI